MKTFQTIAVFVALLLLACTSKPNENEGIDKLNADTDQSDLTPDVSAKALYSQEQLDEIEDFQEAKKRFASMTVEEYKDTYGPQVNYLESLPYNPNDATNMDVIKERIKLSPEQYTLFETKGFVSLNNEKHNTFLSGLVDVYTSDMPLYFSVDAMLDTLHLSFDRILMDLEVFVLSDSLDKMFSKMTEQLSNAEDSLELETTNQSYDDAAVFLCVAHSLLKGAKTTCVRPVDETVNSYLDLVAAEQPADVSFFGKPVTEDFSQFKPRGHYTKKESLKKYFRAMMWIQRIGLDFSERSRHVRLAYVLSDLLHTSASLSEYNQINKTIEMLVGLSDSMNAPQYKQIADQVEINSLDDLSQEASIDLFVETALRQGAGEQKINSAIMVADFSLGAEEFTPIPPAFHFMGQRFIVDSYVFTNVVYDRVKIPKERYMASPLDAWSVLGNREAVALLSDELDTYRYQSNLATLDYLLTTYEEEFWHGNFYNTWLSALMELDKDVTAEAYPAVMKTKEWQHRMLNSQLASWAHLRHDTLLYAKPSYDMSGCDYPDAWVDPYPEFFEKLADIATFALSGFKNLGILDLNVTIPTEDERDEWEPKEDYFNGRSVQIYYERLSEISLMLADIAKTQLASSPLSEPQLEFMNGLIFKDGMSGAPPFNGWYLHLLYGYQQANDDVFDPTIADIHTSVNTGEVLHVGTGFPNLMLLSVETNCQIRAYVGPVLSYHEKIESNFNRLDDNDWKAFLESEQESRPVWTDSFVK